MGERERVCTCTTDAMAVSETAIATNYRHAFDLPMPYLIIDLPPVKSSSPYVHRDRKMT